MTTNCYYNNESCYGDLEACKECDEEFCQFHALTDSLCAACLVKDESECEHEH